MKKVLSLILAFVLVFALSASAFALKSPGGTEYSEVVINQTNTGSNSQVAQKVPVIEGDNIKIEPGKSETLEFEGWKFYKDADKTPAVEGTDYEVVEIKLENGAAAVAGVDYTIEAGGIKALGGKYLTVVVKPLSDKLVVSSAFQGVDIEINEPTVTPPPTSDPTADTSVVVLAVLVAVIVAAGAALIASKKALN